MRRSWIAANARRCADPEPTNENRRCYVKLNHMSTTNQSSEIDFQPEAIDIVGVHWEHSEGDVEEFKISMRKLVCCLLEDAARYSRNSDFYQGLLDECAQHLGKEVYTSDDGSVQDSPLRLRVPELVGKRFSELSGSEALYGFCGWLSTRPEKFVMSDTDDCSVVAETIEKFCKINNLTEPRQDWSRALKRIES